MTSMPRSASLGKKEYGMTGKTERVIADIVALLKEQNYDVPVSCNTHA